MKAEQNLTAGVNYLSTIIFENMSGSTGLTVNNPLKLDGLTVDLGAISIHTTIPHADFDFGLGTVISDERRQLR